MTIMITPSRRIGDCDITIVRRVAKSVLVHDGERTVCRGVGGFPSHRSSACCAGSCFIFCAKGLGLNSRDSSAKGGGRCARASSSVLRGVEHVDVRLRQ